MPLSPSWNQKNLDYEIETPQLRPLASLLQRPWNQKNLDYEIETRCGSWHGCQRLTHLKSKEPRLRDWNILANTAAPAWDKNLKSKEPRLRDWNDRVSPRCHPSASLEIKRTSITRLKQMTERQLKEATAILEIKRTSITRLKHSQSRTG